MFYSLMNTRLHQYEWAIFTSIILVLIGVAVAILLVMYLKKHSKDLKRYAKYWGSAIGVTALLLICSAFNPCLNHSFHEVHDIHEDFRIERVAEKQQIHPSPNRVNYLMTHHFHNVPKVHVYEYL